LKESLQTKEKDFNKEEDTKLSSPEKGPSLRERQQPTPSIGKFSTLHEPQTV
jgi:hypothetical protein